MNSPLLQSFEKNNFKVVFTDLFDTLVHRSKHPNHCLKLWAKFLITELGITITADELFRIRQDTLKHLAKKHKCNSLELDYSALQEEIFERLKNSNLLHPETDVNYFLTCFESADYESEVGVQKINESLVSQLRVLSDKDIRIFLVSDFNLSKSIVIKILAYHGIADLFENVYVSADVHKSKLTGSIYNHLLKENTFDADDVVMVGDNKQSDFVNATKVGIQGVYIPNHKPKLKNKFDLFGSDNRLFYAKCNTVVKQCKKSDKVFSEYLIHYYFFVERVFIHAKKSKIKDLFFLAREGLFLKHLFDDYQELNNLNSTTRINTHYLKISRQASVQISLRPLEKENFYVLKKLNDTLSLSKFLDNFNVPESISGKIAEELKIDLHQLEANFFESRLMTSLRKNDTFISFYEENRTYQKEAFNSYLDSFKVNIEDGMTLVDIGWGGTMQESLYSYFERKIPITGLYLGLKEIYTIEYATRRYGLNFSIYPSQSFSDHILLANGQLYEQLAAAPHGCTIGYSKDEENRSVEFHEENEKYVYDNYIGTIQKYMREQFGELAVQLKSASYSQDVAQEYLTRLALRTGIFMNRRKAKFVNQVAKGFFRNIGDNKVGLNYDTQALPFSKLALLKKLLLNPESVFRYVVKVKPRLYEKGLFPLSFLVNLFYYYVRFHKALKKRFFSKQLIG